MKRSSSENHYLGRHVGSEEEEGDGDESDDGSSLVGQGEVVVIAVGSLSQGMR